MIITVANLKGGVGKTTTTVYLATCAARAGEDVVVLDADNEKSALAWASLGDLTFPVYEAEKDDLVVQAKSLADEGKTVLIDGPPNARDILWASANVADVVLVPVSPTPVDINRLRSTLKVLLNIEAAKAGDLNTKILFTHYNRRTRLARDAGEVLSRFPVLQSTIRNLERYKQEFGTSPKFLSEYEQVWDELRSEA